jgi:hypothetical protein
VGASFRPKRGAAARFVARLDASKLDLKAPLVHRTDRDFVAAYTKAYGKGRVFNSTLGHPRELEVAPADVLRSAEVVDGPLSYCRLRLVAPASMRFFLMCHEGSLQSVQAVPLNILAAF